ncbi:hypothetical protein [Streptomyces sp. NPDC020480]
MELRFASPELDGDEAASNPAEMLPHMPGVPPGGARDVARRPLPELD